MSQRYAHKPFIHMPFLITAEIVSRSNRKKTISVIGLVHSENENTGNSEVFFHSNANISVYSCWDHYRCPSNHTRWCYSHDHCELSSAGGVDASDATRIPRMDQVKNDEREIQGSISYKFIRPTSEWTVLHFIFYESILLSL